MDYALDTTSSRLNTSFNRAGSSAKRVDELITALDQSVHKAAGESIDSNTPKSDIQIDDERRTLELLGLRVKFERIASLHTTRRTYLGLLFALTVIWLVLVVGFVLMAGFGYKGFNLSDSVIIAFITSTTLSVLGLFHFAAKWLFPAKRK